MATFDLLLRAPIGRTVSRDLIARGRDRDLRVKGPIRLPTKVLRITTRKTVCFDLYCFVFPNPS